MKILGQERALSHLAADLARGRPAESYLFAGPEGVGKKTAALEFAKALNCGGEESGALMLDAGPESSSLPQSPAVLSSCGLCPSCRKIDHHTHPDIFILDFDSQAELLDLSEEESARQKDLRIEAVRILIARAFLTPLEAKKKIFVIDGAESLNPAAANALLKVLEESSRCAVWILLSTSPDRMLPTVRSRCRTLSFSLLKKADIEAILKGRLAARPEGAKEETGQWIERAAALSQGSAGLAHFFLEEGNLEIFKLAAGIADPAGGVLAENPLRAAASVLAGGRKETPKRRIAALLKMLALELSRQLRESPSPERAGRLAAALAAGEELSRNISPQLVLESLFFDLAGDRSRRFAAGNLA